MCGSVGFVFVSPLPGRASRPPPKRVSCYDSPLLSTRKPRAVGAAGGKFAPTRRATSWGLPSGRILSESRPEPLAFLTLFRKRGGAFCPASSTSVPADPREARRPKSGSPAKLTNSSMGKPAPLTPAQASHLVWRCDP